MSSGIWDDFLLLFQFSKKQKMILKDFLLKLVLKGFISYTFLQKNDKTSNKRRGIYEKSVWKSYVHSVKHNIVCGDYNFGNRRFVGSNV